jgi:hypothetical protein
MTDWGTCGWRLVSVSHPRTKRVAYMLRGAACIAEVLDSEVHEFCREAAQACISFRV